LTGLHEIPIALAQTTEVLRQCMKDGLVPARILLDQIPAQCKGDRRCERLPVACDGVSGSIPSADQKRPADAITKAAKGEILPSYERFATFVADEYARHGGTAIGLSSLLDGMRRYQAANHEQTTTDMTPAVIQALVLREIAWIDGLLTELAHRAEYSDLQSYRTALNGNPKYIATSADQILDHFLRYVGLMGPRLQELFLNYPRTKMVVEGFQPRDPRWQPIMPMEVSTGASRGEWLALRLTSAIRD
jgi:uncharacterized protein (DUF885 family)